MHPRTLIQDLIRKNAAKAKDPQDNVTSVVYHWKCDDAKGYRTILIYDEKGVFLGTRYADRVDSPRKG